jgi:hypothetical protein
MRDLSDQAMLRAIRNRNRIYPTRGETLLKVIGVCVAIFASIGVLLFCL